MCIYIVCFSCMLLVSCFTYWTQLGGMLAWVAAGGTAHVRQIPGTSIPGGLSDGRATFHCQDDSFLRLQSSLTTKNSHLATHRLKPQNHWFRLEKNAWDVHDVNSNQAIIARQLGMCEVLLDWLLLALLVSPPTVMMSVQKMNLKRTRESVASKQQNWRSSRVMQRILQFSWSRQHWSWTLMTDDKWEVVVNISPYLPFDDPRLMSILDAGRRSIKSAGKSLGISWFVTRTIWLGEWTSIVVSCWMRAKRAPWLWQIPHVHVLEQKNVIECLVVKLR